MLHLYSIYHLNLAFSSIEEEQHPEVIERCYRPLLELAEEGFPIGVEASGYTLERIAELAPDWLTQLRQLLADGKVEFIGSGYSQLIGPLVPALVNRWNQRLGLETYENLLGLRPQLVLVNEQAYSASLVPLYREAGYRALVMEWDNPALAHPEWNPALRYYPQRALGNDGSELPLIWNMSLPFQQFQRYAHGESELDRLLDYLRQHLGSEERGFSLYGNDAEIFDFRPGRFATEADLQGGEWQRIAALYRRLQQEECCSLILPSALLERLEAPEAGHLLSLQTPAQPIPVKKQPKYNISRWAVTGRDDLWLNARCHRLARALEQGGAAADWKALCRFWGSDFRTHITEARWQGMLRKLPRLEAARGALAVASAVPPESRAGSFHIEQNGSLLSIRGNRLHVQLNLRRGLAFQAVALACEPERPLFGTLPHGYFDNIELGADFYSGHLVLEIPGDHKVTDLTAVTPEIVETEAGLRISATLETPLGRLEKQIRLAVDEPELRLVYRFAWPRLPLASLRLGFLTLLPEAFAAERLFFAGHNGGDALEIFPLGGTSVDHFAAASPLVSTSHGLGLTAGQFVFGDDRHQVEVSFDPAVAPLIGHLLHRPVAESYFCRAGFSAREIDDTCSARKQFSPRLPEEIALRLRLR